jgi:hypothetical protein
MPVNTCGHDAPRVILPPRCTQCGAYAHGVSEPYKVSPREWWLLEWLSRRLARSPKCAPPVLEGRITPGDREQP